MRKENSAVNKPDVFYPSLWEWTLTDEVLNDAKWHLYELRVEYPDASLFIDGVHFVENKTNSDIIDAYELSLTSSQSVSTYVGACYHARTKSLIDHFEGDIANLVLNKHSPPKESTLPAAVSKQCTKKCHESIDLNMVGSENLMVGNSF